MQEFLIPVYVTYLVAATALTTLLARSLYRDGAVFLADEFQDRPEVGGAINRLLVTGFYMLNLGYAFFLMRADAASSSREGFEVLAQKLGLLLVSLAIVHFLNLIVFHKIGSRRRAREMAPPIAPQTWTQPFTPEGTAWPAPTPLQ